MFLACDCTINNGATNTVPPIKWCYKHCSTILIVELSQYHH
jgi:hypothetical protein